MATRYLQGVYRGDSLTSRSYTNLIYIFAEEAGTLKEIEVQLRSARILGTSRWQVYHNNAPLWPATEEQPIIVSGESSFTKTGLSIAFVKGDIFTLDCVTGGQSGTSSPISMRIKYEGASVLDDALVISGVIDASANPNYPAADAGDMYRISVAGKIGGVAGIEVEVNDLITCWTDGTASGDQATVGANWTISQTNLINAVTTTDTQTLTNKRITSRVSSIVSNATPTPNADTDDLFKVTALGVNAVFAAPTGTPTSGQSLMLRIKDDGTPRTLGFNAIYRAIGITLPTTTVAGKTIYIGLIYNFDDAKWDAVGVQTQA